MQNVVPKYTLWGEMIREFEGLKLKAYSNKGDVPTIGFGSTYNYTAKRKVKLGDIITVAEASRWLQIDNQEVVRLANHYITQKLTSEQSTAICDYIYNRGIGNFLSTQLDELINANPNDPRIGAEIRGTGLTDRLKRVLPGLVRRRKAQAHLYEKGQLKFYF